MNRHSAIVIGSSMTGLWTARVLADHFDHVTVVERDHLLPEPGPRRGVPQARHVHILLAKGWRLLGELFPGLQEELAAADIPIFDWAAESAILLEHGWAPRYRSGLVLGTMSRDRLEWSIRQRLMAHPKVSFLSRRDVVGLVSENGVVNGVRMRVRGDIEPKADPGADPHPLSPSAPLSPHNLGGTGGQGERESAEEILQAELVVDASGRDSKAPEWLAPLGIPAPAETRINSFLGYATRWYRPPAGFKADWRAMIIGSRPPHNPRAGGIYPVEGGRWMVTLAGAARDYPSTDGEEFLEFARSLPTSRLYEALRDAEPLSPIYGYRRTENRLRHYERLPHWPDGFVALGDAVCAFNPVYGQGMTVGALGALALGECLREAGTPGRMTGMAQRFQKRLAAANQVPWGLATGVDFRYPTTEGGRPDLTARLLHGYIDRVVWLAAEDETVNRAFSSVMHLVSPPGELLHPRIAGRVLAHTLTHRHPASSEPLVKAASVS